MTVAMFEREPAFPQGPVITVDVDSIDNALVKIQSLGGEPVGEKTSVGEMGFAAYFKDTEGNVMLLKDPPDHTRLRKW